MEISGDVPDARRTDGRTREDSATQPMNFWKAESRNDRLDFIEFINYGKQYKLGIDLCCSLMRTAKVFLKIIYASQSQLY